MELGATICTPKNPNCSLCPISEDCLAFKEVRKLTSDNKNRYLKIKSESETNDIEDCVSSKLKYKKMIG